MNSKAIQDLSGRRFHGLLVLDKVDIPLNSYLCKCRCRNLVIVQEKELIAGKVFSCGCKQTAELLGNIVKPYLGDFE